MVIIFEMNKYKKIFIQSVFGILVFSIISCNNNVHPVSGAIQNAHNMKYAKNDIIKINIDKQKDISQIEYEMLIDTVAYVQLDNKIPVAEITDIIIHNDRLFILDETSKKVFIFNKDGHLLHCINKRGRAENEYLLPTAIFLNQDEQKLYIKDGQQSKILCYDYDGKYISSNKAIPAIYATLLNNTNINQLAVGQSFDDNVNYHIVTSIGDSVCRKALPYYPIQMDYDVSDRLKYNYNNELLIHPSLSDTVYSIVNDSTYSAKYVFINKESVWKKANQELSFTDINDLLKSGAYNRIYNFYDTKEYAFLCIVKYNEEIKSLINNYCIYDKIHGCVLNVVNNSEILSINKICPLNVIGVHNNTCIAPINLYMLKRAISENPKIVIKDEKLKEMIDSSSEESNPVLVFYKMKGSESH